MVAEEEAAAQPRALPVAAVVGAAVVGRRWWRRRWWRAEVAAAACAVVGPRLVAAVGRPTCRAAARRLVVAVAKPLCRAAAAGKAEANGNTAGVTSAMARAFGFASPFYYGYATPYVYEEDCVRVRFIRGAYRRVWVCD